MLDSTQIAESKAIQRRTGRTFHVATRLLPERIRHATYVLYAFFRIADDVVDDPNPPPPDVQREALRTIRREALGELETDDPVLAAFRVVCERYEIPDGEVEEFVAAMERDVDPERYGTHDDLDDYLRGSSVAVAYMMVAVMEPDDEATARPHAKALGEAFQLTNFLRDVREDVLEYGRIYLPRSTLDRHGVTDGEIERLEFSERFAAAMRAELERTEALYREGVDGIEYLPADCRFAVVLAAVLYADHHRLIRAQGYDVLSNRPSLSLSRRVELVARTWWHWRRTGDPRETFEAASAVGAGAGEVSEDDRGERRPEDPAYGGDRDGSRPTRWLVSTVRSLVPRRFV
ncbi:MAG: phytoene/squalene synthase family protein [Salinigranum sp.]